MHVGFIANTIYVTMLRDGKDFGSAPAVEQSTHYAASLLTADDVGDGMAAHLLLMERRLALQWMLLVTCWP